MAKWDSERDMSVKITIIIKGHKRALDNVEKRVEKNLYDVFKTAGVEIVSKARRNYLSGGYPQHLRVGKKRGGTLRSNVGHKVDMIGNTVLLQLLIPDVAWYGRLWEAVKQYSYRQGQVFKNGTPKARPFFRPALRDYWPTLMDKMRRLV